MPRTSPTNALFATAVEGMVAACGGLDVAVNSAGLASHHFRRCALRPGRRDDIGREPRVRLRHVRHAAARVREANWLPGCGGGELVARRGPSLFAGTLGSVPRAADDAPQRRFAPPGSRGRTAGADGVPAASRAADRTSSTSATTYWWPASRMPSNTPGTDIGKATDRVNTGSPSAEAPSTVQPGHSISLTCGFSFVPAANVSAWLTNNARPIDAVHRFPIIQVARLLDSCSV